MPDMQGTREGDEEGEKFSRSAAIAQYVPFVIMVLIIFIAIAVGVQQHKYANDQKDFANQTRAFAYSVRKSQYEGCVKGGNVLRQQIRNEFIDLKQDSMIPVYSRIRNTIPPDSPSYKILNQAVFHLYHRIDTIGQRIPNAHCLEAYPPLPGQPDYKIRKHNG